MNKNSLFTKVLAAVLAFAMVFGSLVSLRGVSIVSADSKIDKTGETESTRATDNGGVGHRVITQYVNFSEWKQVDRNMSDMEFKNSGASSWTHIAYWYDGTEAQSAIPAMSATERVWLAQDQYKNPGAVTENSGGKIIKYTDPQGEQFWLTDENNFRGFVYQENYGANKNWWLKSGTYYPANQTPWSTIEKVIYIGTPGTTYYNQIRNYFRDTIFAKMKNEYASTRYNRPSNYQVNGCAIQVNASGPYGWVSEWIGADATKVVESFGTWYKVTNWHSSLTTRDWELFDTYLLPAMVQCAIHALTSGNYNGADGGVINGWPSSHDMNQNQRDPWGNSVARREIARTMYTDGTGNSSQASSYTRMLVNEILRMAAQDNVVVPEESRISYSMPVHEVGRNNQTVVGPNGEEFGYKGVFKAQPPAESKITVTFHAEFYTDVNSDGSLTGQTNTPHTNSGIQWPKDFTFDLGLTDGGTQVATGHTPVMNGNSVANPTSTGKTWDYTWEDMPKSDNYGVTVSNLNDEWVFMPGKTTTETDSDGNVTITGRFLYNRTERKVEKNWINRVTGSTAAPSDASATFQLKQNGSNYGDAVELKGSTWTHTWTKLPKYIRNGNDNVSGFVFENNKPKEYVYSIDETAVSPDGWVLDSTIPGANNTTVFTNAFNQVTQDITVTKHWNPDNAPAGATVKVNLYADGTKVRLTKNLNAAGGWTATWPNLPKYNSDGSEIQYSVKEISMPEGWTANLPAAQPLGNGTLALSITNTQKTINVTVVQEWYTGVEGTTLTGKTNNVPYYGNGENTNTGSYPNKPVNVKIKNSSGEVVGELTLMKGQSWTKTLENLPAGSYTVEYSNETGEASGRPVNYGHLELPTYTTVEKDADGNVKITLKALINKTEVSIRKQWKDANGDDVTPDSTFSATFQLKADGQNEGVAVTISGNTSTYTWTKLDKYKLNAQNKPVEIKYTVAETGFAPSTYNNCTQQTVNGEIVFTNSASEPTKTDIAVNKVWVNNTGVDITFPEITVTLQRRVGNSGSWTDVETVTLNQANSWSKVWGDMDMYQNPNNLSGKYTYQVVEPTLSGYSSTVTKEGDYTFTVTNTKLINITIIQEWYWDIDDNGQPINKLTNGSDFVWFNRNDPDRVGGTNNYDVKANLLRNGVDSLQYSVNNKNNANWIKTIENQPAGEYTLVGYDTHSPESYGWLDLGNDYVTKEVDPVTGDITFTMKALANSVNKSVEKVWADNNTSGNTLTYDKVEVEVVLTNDDGSFENHQTLNAANNWKYEGNEWKWLPKYKMVDGAPQRIEYSVEEVTNLGEGFTTAYNVNGDKTTVTNTKAKTFVDLSVTKVWLTKDGSGTWGDTLPAVASSVTYQLLANGEPYGDPVTKEKGSTKWANHTWEDLPEFDENGNRIAYDVTEVNLDPKWRHESNVAASSDSNGVALPNAQGVIQLTVNNKQNFTRVDLTKQWLYNGTAVTPEAGVNITLDLYRFMEDGAHLYMTTVTLNAANSWHYVIKNGNGQFPEFPYLDEEGNVIRYFALESGYDENVWTPETDAEGRIFLTYDQTYNSNDGGFILVAKNNRSGNYELDKTAKLKGDGTYTATLTAQYNGPTGSNNPDTYISDTLGLDFHVEPGYTKDNVTVYIEKYNKNGTFTRVAATDPIYNGVTVTAARQENRSDVTTGDLAGANDKDGLKVTVTGFDLEGNGCYVDANGTAHGYRIVVEINKLLANGDAAGDRLPIGDAPLNDIAADLESGVCGIYTGSSIATADLVDGDDVRKDAKLIFPKPTVQIREMVQVYDFGLRQRNDDLLDFFGHGNDYSAGMGDIAHVLSVDYMYADQTAGYHYTYPYAGAAGRNASLEPITYTTATLENEEFEVGLVTVYTGSGNPGSGWTKMEEYNNKYVWTNTGSHPDHNVPHSCFGYFEPKEITVREFTLAALVEVAESDATHSECEYAWCKITFMPATNVYYEAEDFLAPDPDVVAEKPFAADWALVNPVTDAYAKHDRYQNHSTGDLQHVYGYDDAYVDGHTGSEDDLHNHAPYDAFGLSNGQALKVTLTADDADKITAKTHQWPSVEFSFTGEALEVIASTNATSGFIAVQLTKTKTDDGKWDFASKNCVVTKYVDTRYFGANPSDEGDTDYTNAEGNLKQIPVIRIAADKKGNALANTTYGVRISAVYLKSLVPIKGTDNLITIPGLDGEFEYESVYGYELGYATRDEVEYPDMTVELDAVRIFNPYAADVNVKDHMDSENNGAYETIKNIIRKSQIFSNSVVSGGIYIDYIHVVGGENNEPIIPDGSAEGGYSINDYLQFGPNNEMYLKSGNAFAFVVDNVAERQSIHLGAKTPNGTANANTAVVISGTVYGMNSKGELRVSREITPMRVDSATPMYYSISDSFVKDNGLLPGEEIDGPDGKIVYEDYTRNLVVIKCEVCSFNSNGQNTGTVVDNDAILSLTNIKVVNEAKRDNDGSVSYSRPNILGDTEAPANGNVVGTKGETDESPAIIMTTEAYEAAMALVCGIKGDIDGDKSVCMIDAITALRASLGTVELNNYGKICGDMDDNHHIDMIDAMSIMRAAFNF